MQRESQRNISIKVTRMTKLAEKSKPTSTLNTGNIWSRLSITQKDRPFRIKKQHLCNQEREEIFLSR